MRTSLVLSLLFPLLASAQVPAFTIDFIPAPPDEKRGRNSGFQPLLLTGSHAIYQVRNYDTNDRTLYTDARTGGEAIAHPISVEAVGGGQRQKWLTVKGKVYTVIADHEFKTGSIRFLVEPRSADGGEALGAPWEVGRLVVEKRSYLNEEQIGLTIALSPNEERCALYFDRLRSAEKEQLVMCWVLDSDMRPVWQNGYKVDFESETLSTADVKVTDQGSIYALMRSRFKNRAITNKYVNYSYKMFLMVKEYFHSSPVDLPEGLTALHCRMVLRPGGIRCAGFHVQPEQTIKETAGSFVLDMDEDLVATGEATIHRYSQPLEEQIIRAELKQRPDGGCFLIGGSWDTGQNKVTERMLVVRSIDPKGASEWEQRIPRRLISEPNEEYGFRALQHDNRLIVCFPDDRENLELYRTRMEPKRMASRSRIIITAAFDAQGTPTYGELGGGRYPCDLGVFDISDERGTWLGCSRINIDKKTWRSGIVLLRME